MSNGAVAEVEMLQQQVQNLVKEKRGLEEMLFFVLKTVVEPVAINKEDLKRGAGRDQMINIEDNLQTDQFVFSVVEVPDVV